MQFLCMRYGIREKRACEANCQRKPGQVLTILSLILTSVKKEISVSRFLGGGTKAESDFDGVPSPTNITDSFECFPGTASSSSPH